MEWIYNSTFLPIVIRYMLRHIKQVVTVCGRGRIQDIARRVRHGLCQPRIQRPKGFRQLAQKATGKKGLEIGGPSAIFDAKGSLPLYQSVGHLDGCNFSERTIWEGDICEGQNYRFGGRTGYQYINEATCLRAIESHSYDFVLASHCLEHIANPLLAISEWLRILRPGGFIVLVLPDGTQTFDHRRPTTTFVHLLSDYSNSVKEDDLSHLDEILTLHDLAMDPPAGNVSAFEKRSRENIRNRCLHHHVFDLNLLKTVCAHFELETFMEAAVKPYHLIVAASKKPNL